MYFANQSHEERFIGFLSADTHKYSSQYLAAVYLLAASADVWKRARKCISGGSINWSAVDLRGISVIGYGVFQLARDFAFGSVHCTFRDLCDTQIITDRFAELTIEGIRIGREGYRRTGMKKAVHR